MTGHSRSPHGPLSRLPSTAYPEDRVAAEGDGRRRLEAGESGPINVRLESGARQLKLLHSTSTNTGDRGVLQGGAWTGRGGRGSVACSCMGPEAEPR